MGFTSFPTVPGPLAQVAATPAAGFALQNATPTVISWTAPSDGKPHRAMVVYTLHVTVAETGGAVVTNFVAPDAGVGQSTPFAGGAGTGVFIPNGPQVFEVGAGTVVSVVQSTALTTGAATLWAEIWGS